jgi:menaquinone-9 beta-reductase
LELNGTNAEGISMQKFDVVVVGGGPAGSSAAYVLARHGMRVAMVEKKVFPRDKLCGGLLSERARTTFLEIFGDVWGPTIEVTSYGVNCYSAHQYVNGVDNYRPIYFTSRRNFDAYLAELAESRGATLIQGATVSSFSTSPTEVRLKNGTVLKSDFVVGADGVSSRIAETIFPGSLDTQNLALGLEIELPLSDSQRTIAVPEIHFGVVRWGYGWIFPKQSTLTVGIGGLLKENPNLKDLFTAFLIKVNCHVPDIRCKGHHIPFGNYKLSPGRSNVLLVGDAAGLVEPVTGEGIAYAMQSGKYAAEAIVKASEAGDLNQAFGLYLGLYRSLITTFSQARVIRTLIFPQLMQTIFVAVLRRSKSPIKKYLDLLAGQSDYKDYTKFMVQKAVMSLARNLYAR